MSLRAVWWIALNELRRLAVDRTTLFFGLLLPVVIIVIIGSTFGTTGSIELGAFDADGSTASRSVVMDLAEIEGVELERYDSLDELSRDVRTRVIDGAVVLQDGYERSLAGGTAEVELLTDPSADASGTVLAAVESAVAGQGVRAAAEAVLQEQGAPAEATQAAVAAAGASLVPVGVEEAALGSGERSFGSFSYTAPSSLVLFVFVNTFAISTLLATDRKRGVIDRLLATPHRTRTVLAGIGASKLLFALVQSALIVAIGALLFDVGWGAPIAAVALAVLFAVVSTAVGLAVGTVVSDADQAQGVGVPVAIAMGMLGGCMWPLDVVPDVMRVAGHVTPHAWAMDAWSALVFDGASLGDILPELAVLAAFAVLVGVVATRRLRAVVAG